MHTFDAEIQASRGGAFIHLPFDVHEVFGTKGQVKVKATFDGAPYRGSLTPMDGRHLLIVRKDIRALIGKQPGDTVHVTLGADTEPRVVEVPEDLAAALATHPDAQATFDGFAYTHRKEYVAWIEGAKQDATRRRRIEQAVEMIAQGQKRS